MNTRVRMVISLITIMIVFLCLHFVENGIVITSGKDSIPAADTEGPFPNQKGFPIDVEGNINDGDVEIGIGLNGIGIPRRVYVWDLPYKYRPDCQDWPQYHHDPGHSGNYQYPEGLPILPQVPALTPLSLLLLLL